MQKEILAVFLLVFLLAAVLVNNHVLKKMTDSVLELVEEAESAAQQENWQEAAKRAESAKAYWDKNSSYTHIVMRHSKLDDTTQAFCNFLTEIYKCDKGGVKGMAESLKEELNALYTMEKLKIGSLF